MNCRACRRALEMESRFYFYVSTDLPGHERPPEPGHPGSFCVGPVCFVCADYAMARLGGPTLVQQENPDGATTLTYLRGSKP